MECEVESEGMHYEGMCIRPPSEAYSILLQVTLGCSHNKCAFCGTYKDKRFTIKDDKIILSDILFASKVHEAARPGFPHGRRRSDHSPEEAHVDPGQDQGASPLGQKSGRLRECERASR